MSTNVNEEPDEQGLEIRRVEATRKEPYNPDERAQADGETYQQFLDRTTRRAEQG
jgi:hypothetical protein